MVIIPILICITILILLLWLLWMIQSSRKMKRESFEDSTTVSIPKKVWTYWHDDNMPPIVTRCIETWKRYNPDYQITVLNDRSVAEICGGFQISSLNIPDDFHARHADYARILVVKMFGGIWMDSSLICTQSFQWLQEYKPYDLLGYFAPSNLTTSKEFPILENWFFAAPMGSKFIQDWWDEVIFMNSFNQETDYVKYIKDQHIFDIQQLETQLPYLVMHLCATVVHQRNPSKYDLILMDSEKGPYQYLVQNDWDHVKSFEALCQDPELNRSPILKLRGVERRFLEHHELRCELTDFNKDVHGVVQS